MSPPRTTLRKSHQMPPTPASQSPPDPAEFADQLLRRLDKIEKRGVRIESKVMRVLEHLGLDANGQPIVPTVRKSKES